MNESELPQNSNPTSDPAVNPTPSPDVPSPKKAAKKVLGVDDAEYLNKYLKISDDYLDGKITLDAAEARLNKLNKEFKGKISPKSKRTAIVGGHLSTEGGWAPSQVCW